MSSNLYRTQLEQLQKAKAGLEDDLAKERAKLAKLQREASNLQRSITTTKSAATRQSKQRQYQSKQDQIAKSQKKIADIEAKITRKITAINQKTKALTNAEAREGKKRQKADIQHLQDINAEIEQQMLLESARQAANLVSGGTGEPLRLSAEAKAAARQLLEMFEQGQLEKEIRLIPLSTFDGTRILLAQPDGQTTEFPVPIEDIKELAAYGVLSLPETIRKGRRTGWNMLLLPERLKEAIAETVLPDMFRIFYSWQSWTPGNVNRHFVLEAIEKAAKQIHDDDTIAVEPVVDRDTLGEAGSVDIAATIFGKIDKSHVFICDVTIVTDPDASHPIPNPNVLVELGYAAAILGWERIICVVNTAYGGVEKMPFDLRTRRLLAYELPSGASGKGEIKRRLISDLQGAIKVIIEKTQAEASISTQIPDSDNSAIDNDDLDEE